MKKYERLKIELHFFAEEDLLSLSDGENGVTEIGYDWEGGLFK